MDSASRQSIRHTLNTRIGLIILAIGLAVGALFFLFSMRLSGNEIRHKPPWSWVRPEDEAVVEEAVQEALRRGDNSFEIICSGFSDRINADTFDQAGVQGFLTKPVRTRDLSKTIRRILDPKS